MKAITDLLGLSLLVLGSWGMYLIFPNLQYFSHPSPDTCELGPLIGLFIPSIIIAIVIAILIVVGLYYTVRRYKTKKQKPASN